MAKKAATEEQLGTMHSALARVFTKILLKYEHNLDALSRAEVEDEVSDELAELMLNTTVEPNPAMLSAISKFLKDNEIGIDSAEVDALSDTERRLEAKRKARQKAGLSVVDIGLVANGS